MTDPSPTPSPPPPWSLPSGSIDRWIEHRAVSAGETPAVVFEGTLVTYGQLAGRLAAVATGLAADGVGPGDRVVYCGLNRPELLEALFACARLGAIFCPLNNRLTAAELAVLLDDAQPAALVATDGFAPVLTEAAGRADHGFPPVRDLDHQPFPDTPDADGPPAAGGGDGAAPVLMVYTSGTTGRPKGAVHTNDSIRLTCENGLAHQGLNADSCIIAPLPTFHVGGLNIQTLPTLAVGGQVVLQRRFDPDDVLDLIERHRPTQTLLVPAMLQAVSGHPRFASTDLSSLEGINTGSSIVPDEVTRPFFDRGVPVGQVYGTTESGPTAVVLGYDEAAAHPGSCGRPAVHTEMRVVDESTGIDRPAGEGGEVWLRGPNLFDRYWENPDATAAAFAGDWYRTGDVGYLDAEGWLHISDRLSDVVISGGENVYPAELEVVLGEHSAVAEIAVVGRPDDRWGEIPVAVVVPVEGASIELDELRTWAGDRLARYKLPRRLELVDELPRTALGKVRKHVLRHQLEADEPS